MRGTLAVEITRRDLHLTEHKKWIYTDCQQESEVREHNREGDDSHEESKSDVRVYKPE